MSSPLEELEEKAREVGRLIDHALNGNGPKIVGFVLALLDQDGLSYWISNASLEEMAAVMEAFLAKQNDGGGNGSP